MKVSAVVLAVLAMVAVAAATDYGAYNTRTGKSFLEAKSKEAGVVVLDSGLMYKVITAGTSTLSPSRSDTVRVQYEGRLINGKVFDSSYQRGQPAEFGVGNVIRGWTEALQIMHVGDTYELYIPSELAYGARGAGGLIGPNAVLVFKVELLGVVGRSEL